MFNLHRNLKICCFSLPYLIIIYHKRHCYSVISHISQLRLESYKQSTTNCVFHDLVHMYEGNRHFFGLQIKKSLHKPTEF